MTITDTVDGAFQRAESHGWDRIVSVDVEITCRGLRLARGGSV